MASDPFTDLVAATDPAMVVVTAAVEEERAGCLVGFHGQTSIEPPRYAVWLSKANHTFRVARDHTHLGVHLLASDDLEVATRFGTVSGDDVDKFDSFGFHHGLGGVPLLDAVANRMVLAISATLDTGGDHVCFIGEPVHVEGSSPATPLRLSQVTHLDPGHDAEERAHPPTERSPGEA